MANPSILIVEDEPGLAELYELWLAEAYSVDMATTGDRALEMMNPEIDVVLLDRRMPGKSGDQVLHLIRSQGFECSVAMQSAVTADRDILEMDIDAYNSKPINQTKITNTVEKLVRRAKYDEEVRQLLAVAERYAAVKSSITHTESPTRDQLDKIKDKLESRTNRLQSQIQGINDEDRRFLQSHLSKISH